MPGPVLPHGQFIAQLDSVCQPFVTPVDGTFSTYTEDFRQMIRSAKRVFRADKAGNRKAFKKSSKASVRASIGTGNALNALAQVEANLIAQIDTLTPPLRGGYSTGCSA